MANRKKFASKSFDAEGVTIAFENGRTIRVRYADLSAEMRAHAMGHGLVQKFGDAYAGAESIEHAIAQCEVVVQQVYDGDWNRKADGVSGYLAEALSEATGKPLDTVRTIIAGMDAEKKKLAAKHPQVAAIIKRLQAEAAEKRAEGSGEFDLGSLLGDDDA